MVGSEGIRCPYSKRGFFFCESLTFFVHLVSHIFSTQGLTKIFIATALPFLFLCKLLPQRNPVTKQQSSQALSRRRASRKNPSASPLCLLILTALRRLLLRARTRAPTSTGQCPQVTEQRRRLCLQEGRCCASPWF